MIIDKINSPEDLKNLSQNELDILKDEIRDLIIKKTNSTGGHMGPNLGIVELTIALHTVFNAPKDKIVFDVSHQCYTHKILTGRKEGFLKEENYFKYTGYTAPEESEYDLFKVGHTSTAISLACGIAKARDLNNGNYNVIAIVGDGSLSGGEALEGLDNAALLNSNFIVILNDNEMSIAENYGGIYKNLKLLRDTNGNAECNMFKALGYDYYYLENGNNISDLINLFSKIKDTQKPVLLHIHTLKGKGLKVAEDNKEMFHWIMPNTLENMDKEVAKEENYTSVTTDFLLKKAKNDKSVVVINAATPGALGLDKTFRETLKEQYVDVGICEEHAVAFSAALAKNNAKPFFTVLSSFIQRTYDQISQEICLNNAPVKILVNWGGLSEADATHLSSFDIPFISNIPNMVYMAPVNKEEYLAMLEYAYTETTHPVAIRVPSCELKSIGMPDKTDYSKLNKFKLVNQGEKVAVIAAGSFFDLGEEVKNELEKLNINATLINPVFLSGIDTDLLNELKANHSIVITLEDGQLNGGFGEKIATFYADSNMKVLCFGGKKEFTDRMPLNKIYERNHLTKELILQDIKNILN